MEILVKVNKSPLYFVCSVSGIGIKSKLSISLIHLKKQVNHLVEYTRISLKKRFKDCLWTSSKQFAENYFHFVSTGMVLVNFNCEISKLMVNLNY